MLTKKLLIIADPRSTCLDLNKKVDNNLKHEIDHIIRENEFLVKQKIKNEINQ